MAPTTPIPIGTRTGPVFVTATWWPNPTHLAGRPELSTFLAYLERALGEAVKDPRTRQAFALRYGIGQAAPLSTGQVGTALGVSHARITQLLTRGWGAIQGTAKRQQAHPTGLPDQACIWVMARVAEYTLPAPAGPADS